MPDAPAAALLCGVQQIVLYGFRQVVLPAPPPHSHQEVYHVIIHDSSLDLPLPHILRCDVVLRVHSVHGDLPGVLPRLPAARALSPTPASAGLHDGFQPLLRLQGQRPADAPPPHDDAALVVDHAPHGRRDDDAAPPWPARRQHPHHAPATPLLQVLGLLRQFH